MAQTEYEKELTRRKRMKESESQEDSWEARVAKFISDRENPRYTFDQQMQQRTMGENERNGRSLRFTQETQANLAKRAADNALFDDVQKKHDAFNMADGKMNKDVYVNLYGTPGDKDGKVTGGISSPEDITSMLNKAWEKKGDTETRPYSQFMSEELTGLSASGGYLERFGSGNKNPDAGSQMFKVGRGGKQYDVDTSGIRAKWSLNEPVASSYTKSGGADSLIQPTRQKGLMAANQTTSPSVYPQAVSSPPVSFRDQLSGGFSTPPVNRNMKVDLLPKIDVSRNSVDWKENRKKRGIRSDWGY